MGMGTGPSRMGGAGVVKKQDGTIRRGADSGIAAGIGILSGRVEVRGPDGKLKGSFDFESACTEEQAENLGLTEE